MVDYKTVVCPGSLPKARKVEFATVIGKPAMPTLRALGNGAPRKMSTALVSNRAVAR